MIQNTQIRGDAAASVNRNILNTCFSEKPITTSTITKPLTITGGAALAGLEGGVCAGLSWTDDRVALDPAHVTVAHRARLAPARPLGTLLVEHLAVETRGLLRGVGVTVDVVHGRHVVVVVVRQAGVRDGHLDRV